MWKWLLGVFLFLVIACGVGGYFFATSPQFGEMKKKFSGGGKATEVRLESVERGTLVRSVSAPGSVEAKSGVDISAQVSAKIMALPFRPGQAVQKGDVIVRLDSRDMEASLESAQASKAGEEARLAGAQAMLDRAKSDLERQRALVASKDVSASVLEIAQAQFLQAESTFNGVRHSIEIAQANIRRVDRDLENTVIKSPIDGIVTALNMEEGEQVLGTFNNAGTVIMEIANLDTMIVKARVDESTVNPVVEKQHARVYINMYPDAKFSGTVTLVGLKNLTDKDGTRYVEVEILLESTNGQQLRTGLTANVDIEVQTLADVLKVPSQAVVDRRVDDLPKSVTEGPGKDLIDKSRPFTRVVYIIEEGKAKAVPVSIGASDLTHTIITAGLKEGDRVVAGPFKVLVDLKDGKEIVEQTAEEKDKATDEAKAAIQTKEGT
ncbi:MAG: efflux RND transporter periplasmic adaptor subunit [Pyrinomonadaceae bacterium]|nr:efflux RND transporter periplasmic adaptor subunit [Phycisphaerales bacterium]